MGNEISTRPSGRKRVTWTNPVVPENGKLPGDWPETIKRGEPLPSMTQQQFKAECDVNVLVNKYLMTGNKEILEQAKGYYGDATKMPTDYAGALRQIEEANDQFMKLPAGVRAEFNNDPGELTTFMLEKKDIDKAIRLGLVSKPEAPKPPAGEPTGRVPVETGAGST